jgi:hypothetical protein
MHENVNFSFFFFFKHVIKGGAFYKIAHPNTFLSIYCSFSKFLIETSFFFFTRRTLDFGLYLTWNENKVLQSAKKLPY